jgi:type III pantothenate kinase
MKQLFVDVGNSRVKYALDDGAPVAIAHEGEPAVAIARMLDAVERPDEVILVDVTGAAERALSGYAVRVLRSSAACCGVTNAYPEPERLGADRWAALIGARARHRGAVCIVDAGSAITVDALDADGRHLGGWIAPGLALGVAALARGTRFARGAIEGRALDEFATDTADAIRAGVRNAALGFVERAARAATQALTESPQLVLCGGDAATLGAAFPDAVVDEPLVLRGLMAWARSR